MGATNIILLQAARDMKKAREVDHDYQARIMGMDKVDLLNEMVSYQEERTRSGQLTPTMMVRGKILFKALEENAETEALRALSKSYRRHLEFELRDYLSNPTKNDPEVEGESLADEEFESDSDEDSEKH